MFLSDICIRRPVFATMMITALVVMGIFSFRDLGIDLYPKVDYPMISIITTLRGASAEEIETQITKPIEEAVNTVGGLDELRSVSVEGVSQVVATFVLEKNTDVASQEVRDRIGRMLNQLPDGTDPPVIEKMDPDASPIISLAVSGPRDLKELTFIAKKQIKEPLEAVNGVGAIVMVGGRERAIQVSLDGGRLWAYGLSSDDVKRALRNQNLELPGGRVDRGEKELALRTMGRIDRVPDFNKVIIAYQNGAPIRISDIGHAEDGVEEPTTLARLDGVNCVSLLIRKQSGLNTVEVIDGIKTAVAKLRSTLPKDIRIEVIRDQSRFIVRSIDTLKEHLILGGIMASFVVYLFMRNWRSTLIAAIAIPTSLISTFTIMKYAGYTLNNMTMLGLTVAVGIVIDDAIVVLENIFRHIEERGTQPMEAASTATREISLAVLATTLSLVIIFLPLGFMKGTIGRFFSSFGITTAFSIMVSLFVSFTLTPTLCSRFLKTDGGRKHKRSKDNLFYSVIEKSYSKVLSWSMRHRWAVALLGIAVILSTVPLYNIIGKDYLPYDDQSEFEIAVRAPDGTSLEGTDKVFQGLESEIKQLPGVTTVLTSIGESSTAGVNSGTIYVRLIDLDQRKFSQFDVMAQVRGLLRKHPDLRCSVQSISTISSSSMRQTPVNFALRGPDLKQLEEYSKKLVDQVKNVPGLVDLDTTLELGKPELRVEIDRDKAADLGVDVNAVASALLTMVGGTEDITKYKEEDEMYQVRVRVVENDRNSPEAIYALYVPSKKVGLVPLSNIVRLTESRGPAQIERLDRMRQVAVLANLQNKTLGSAMDDLKTAVKKLDLMPGYTTKFLGRGQRMLEAMQNFALALGLSMIFMYLVLASQFESFLHPVTIMLAIPLSIPFALISLMGTGESLNIYSTLGVFMLFGVVKKNAILQVDYTNTLRSRGMDRLAAIMEANRARLRPILMTTVTLLAGMMPIAMGKGPGSATRASMAKVIIGGQALCLLITLVMAPVVYSLFDDIVNSRPVQRLLGKK